MNYVTSSEQRFAHERSYKRASILWGMIGFFMIALAVYGVFHAIIREHEYKQRDVTQFAIRGDIDQLIAPRDWE